MSGFDQECTSCYATISGRVIHDQGFLWCEPCRLELTRHRAELRADRLVRRDIELARAVADLQVDGPWRAVA